MSPTTPKGLKTTIKLEIMNRIIKNHPVSLLIDELKPQEIIQVHQFVLEKALEIGKAVKGESFSQKDITKHLEPLNLEKIDETKFDSTNKNLLHALEKTKKQIDTISQIVREYALNESG